MPVPAPQERLPKFSLPLYPGPTAWHLGGSSRSIDFSSDDLLDRPIVINFWATWCHACDGDRGFLSQVYRDYAGRAEFVSVAAMDSAKAIEKSKKATTIPYPVLLDSDGNLLKALGAGTIPVTFVFDRAQKKILEVIGPLNPKEQDRVRAALAQSLPTRS